MTPVQICFTPDAAELRAVQAAYSKSRPRMFMGLAIALAAVFFFEAVLGLMSSHNVLLHYFAYFQMFFGVWYIFTTWNLQKTQLLEAKPSAEIGLTIDDDGITVKHPAMRIPWNRIYSIRDVGEALVAVRIGARSIPILKRALPDGGRALWAALDAKLTGKRYLVRGADSRLTITNSAALR